MTGRRRFAVLILVPLAASGTAYLASTVVAASNAGVSAVAVAVPTTIAPAPATVTDTSGYAASMAATLTGGGSPLASETLQFVIGSATCSAPTDSSGTATCSITGLTTTPTSYTVSFAGNTPFAASTAAGGVSP